MRLAGLCICDEKVKVLVRNGSIGAPTKRDCSEISQRSYGQKDDRYRGCHCASMWDESVRCSTTSYHGGGGPTIYTATL